jgi:hypothetical protein
MQQAAAQALSAMQAALQSAQSEEAQSHGMAKSGGISTPLA